MSTETQGYRSRSQQDAAKVYEKVADRANANSDKNASSDKKDRYSSMCKNLPVLIRTAGLVQALTFLQAKASDEGLKWLGDDLGATLGYGNLNELAKKARCAELAEYMVLTQRALEQLLWYKRYAQVLLDGEKSSG